MTEQASERRAELEHNLEAVRSRIDDACRRAGRAPQDVTLIVVTKTYPASDVALLAELGVREVGENRHPEAGDKATEVSAPLRWHFVGGLQTNKAGAVARYADVVQSVDRAKLARSLSRGAEAAGREVECLVQVDFDGSDEGRAGVLVDDAAALADLVAGLPGLRLGGLMTVAPLGADPRATFDALGSLSATIRQAHPDATTISAGMSEDFEDAVAAGATHLRIGRAVLGERPVLR